MTPAIKSLEKARAIFNIHEYTHDSAAESYGLEAAENHSAIYVSAGRRGLEVEVAPQVFKQLLRASFFDLTRE